MTMIINFLFFTFFFFLVLSLQVGSTNSSPMFSSPENSFDKTKPVVSLPSRYWWFDLGEGGATWWPSHLAVVSDQNTSLSSLDDSFDQLDGSESQSLQEPPLHKAHRGRKPGGHTEQKQLSRKQSSRDSQRPLVHFSSFFPSFLSCFLRQTPRLKPTARPSGVCTCSRATARPQRSCLLQVRHEPGAAWSWNITFHL